MAEVGTIQKTITLVRDALEGLDADISLLEIEDLAIMVHRAMTVQARVFHTPEHIFDLADASNPIKALAALFHDIVYYQVDRGFTPEIHALIGPYICMDEGRIRLTQKLDPGDTLFQMTLAVFDYEIGQVLDPYSGQNEFLSALAMTEALEGIVAARDLVKTSACIEATIPFRGRSARRRGPADVLEQRLIHINEAHALGMTQDEIYDAVRWAVAFSNKDVESFCEEDAGRFLDGTWKLLPESNPALRMKGIYSITSYYQALKKMEGFLSQLNPDHIFNQYRGVPSESEYQRMVALAHRNVSTARQYLVLKLLAAMTLEAIAQLTGGDAPMALFMGDIEGSEDTHCFEDFLPDVPISNLVDESSTLFGLLAFGRASASSFDMQNSPLSLFIYRSLGVDKARHLLAETGDAFLDTLSAEDFLALLPALVAAGVAEACAQMVPTRTEALLEYAASRRAEAM